MNKRPEAGFTLVELGVAVVILGILLTITVSGTSNLVRSTRLAGASNTLAADLRYARSLSTAQRKNFQVIFQPSGYSVFRVSPADTVIRRVFPNGVTCTATDTATFYAWGLTDPVTITLTGAGHTKALALSVSGNVTHP